MRRRLPALVLLLCLLFSSPEILFAKAFPKKGLVTRVIDGDTVVLESGEHVRLLGINAPEYEPWKSYEEPYGKEAALYLRSKLSGKKVLLEKDQELLDRYGRTLAYLYLEDRTFINEDLVLGGYAKARYYAPNGKYFQKLKAAEKIARQEKRGLWRIDNLSRKG